MSPYTGDSNSRLCYPDSGELVPFLAATAHFVGYVDLDLDGASSTQSTPTSPGGFQLGAEGQRYGMLRETWNQDYAVSADNMRLEVRHESLLSSLDLGRGRYNSVEREARGEFPFPLSSSMCVAIAATLCAQDAHLSKPGLT